MYYDVQPRRQVLLCRPTPGRHGLPRTLKINNPFEWMDMIIIQGNVNFLEKHVVEYLFKIGIGSGQSIRARADQTFALYMLASASDPPPPPCSYFISLCLHITYHFVPSYNTSELSPSPYTPTPFSLNKVPGGQAQIKKSCGAEDGAALR